MHWSAPQRPVEYSEQALVTAILEGKYSPGSTLPGERELAAQLGVTRPTLREAMRRLESDGWLTVQQGKPTRVNNFWTEGGLNVLSSLVRYSSELPENFVMNLLEVRLALAPVYTREAVKHSTSLVVDCLKDSPNLADTSDVFANFDWRLHKALTIYSRNPIYTLILNGFAGFYEEMAQRYFEQERTRASSRRFYASLLDAAQRADAEEAEAVTKYVMMESIHLWQETSSETGS